MSFRCAAWCGLAALVCLWPMPPASAQRASDASSPPGWVMRAAGGSCARDDAPVAAPAAATPSLPAPDLSCALDVPGVLQAQSRGEVLLADLRLPTERAQYHIAASLPLDLATLRGKPYWREKTVVLVGSGPGEAELYRACAVLKSTGYRRVSVLRGGMASWLWQKQPVLGGPPSAQELTTLSAGQLWHEAQFESNVVLVTPERAGMESVVPFAFLMKQPGAEGVRQVLDRRRKELKDAPLAAVVLVAGAEMREAASVDGLRRALAPVPLLVFTGSREQFAQQVSRQQAVWSAHQRGPKPPPCGR